MTEKKIKGTKQAKTQKKKKRPPEGKDFQKYALVAASPPKTADPLVMDGTSHVEISLMVNRDYSSEIVGEAENIFDLSALKKEKEKGENLYLKEAERQIKELWRCMEALTVHTTMFNVSFLISIGILLNDAERTLESKARYMKWLRDHFGHKHLRYFQHAKQLARMGEFARKYASLGKNRLLDFDRLAQANDRSHEDILREHPFMDTTEDIDGSLFKEHVDAVITYQRFEESGLDLADFQDASLIAAIEHKPMEVGKVKKLKDWVQKQDNPKEAFEHFLMNKLAFPYGVSQASQSPPALNKLLAGLAKFISDADIEDPEWVEEQKKHVSPVIMVQAHKVILRLAGKFGINLTS